MAALTDFELVLVNGDVVRQDVGYNSMLGQIEPENWFYFESGNYVGEQAPEYEIIQDYRQACAELPSFQEKNKSIHLVNAKVASKDYSVMCIPAKSILCIRKTVPWDEYSEEGVPIQESVESGQLEEALSQPEPRQPTFERIRRPVIRRKNDTTREGGSSDGGRTDRVASHDVSEENSKGNT